MDVSGSTEDESTFESSDENENQTHDEDESDAEEAIHPSIIERDESLGADSLNNNDGGQDAAEAERPKNDDGTSKPHGDGPAGKHDEAGSNIDQSQDKNESGAEEDGADSTNGRDGGQNSQKVEYSKDDGRAGIFQ